MKSKNLYCLEFIGSKTYLYLCLVHTVGKINFKITSVQPVTTKVDTLDIWTKVVFS